MPALGHTSPKGPPGQPLSRRSFLRGALCGTTAAVLGGAYADCDVNDVRLERVELRLKRWHADGLRVAFITDIHVNDSDEMERARNAAFMLVAESPDILLFGGDCMNRNSREGLEHTSAAFEPFQRIRCPKIAVFGNHDYASGRVEDIKQRLTQHGFRPLKNETADFGEYRIAGYDDQVYGDRDDAFQPSGPVTIALLHEPDFVDIVPSSVSLQLSGHSHGGQICLPFGKAIHTPYGARKYKRGFFGHAKVPLYVSRGVGTTGFKWRMFCPPEITLLTLRSA